MVYEYFLATGDLDFVQYVLPLLEKEHNFWVTHRAVPYIDDETGEELFQFFQYKATMKTPRPESYREDMELVKDLKTEGKNHFACLKASSITVPSNSKYLKIFVNIVISSLNIF